MFDLIAAALARRQHGDVVLESESTDGRLVLRLTPPPPTREPPRTVVLQTQRGELRGEDFVVEITEATRPDRPNRAGRRPSAPSAVRAGGISP